MFNYISTLFKKVTNKVKHKVNKLEKPALWIIFSYAGLVALFVLTYYSAWLYMWFYYKESLQSLLSLIKEMTGPAVVGFITFVALSTVDSDGDGIPDSIDKDGDDHPRGRP